MVHVYDSTDGEAVKKKEVANHKYRCRNCQRLPCRGCGQDVGGDEYNEKYSGKCSIQDTNDGKKTKQSRNTIRASVKTMSLNPDLALALRTRRRVCKSLKLEHHLFEEAVDIFSKVRQEFIKSWDANKMDTVKKNDPESPVDEKMEPEETAEPSCSKSMKQRKRKHEDSLENGDGRLSWDSPLAKKRNAKDRGREIGAGDANGADVDKEVAIKESRKHKKRKHHCDKNFVTSDGSAPCDVDGGDAASGATSTDVEVPSKEHKKKNRDAEVVETKAEDVENDVRNGDRKRKKKKGHSVECNESLPSEQTVTEEADSQANHETAKAPRFSWGSAIMGQLQNASEDGLRLKKLQKKTISDYRSYYGTCDTDKVQLEAVFMKKLKRLSNLTLDGDRVTIVE